MCQVKSSQVKVTGTYNHGCARHCFIDILSDESNVSILLSRSAASGGMSGQRLVNGLSAIGNFGKVEYSARAASGHISDDPGVPILFIIRSNVSISESPGKSALPHMSSPRIHPIDHISIPASYRQSPSKISGALYHKVTTSCVNVFLGSCNHLASPKSPTFIRFKSRETNKLC